MMVTKVNCFKEQMQLKKLNKKPLKASYTVLVQ